MFDPFKKLKLAGAFLGAPDDAVAGAPESLDISELFGRLSLKDLRGMTLNAEALLDQPGVRALFETRYMPPPESLDKLSDLGDGTLGFEYARYIRHYKLSQPQLPRRADYADPANYLAQRVRMTHALLHVITEYDASPLGELALQAYYIGQLGNLISGVIVSSAILQITRDTPDLLGPALEVTSEAYQRGKAARSFLGIAWEELWSAQVPQLRELIEIPSRSSAVAHLRIETPVAPKRSSSAPERSATRSGGTFTGFGGGTEDGFASLITRSNSPSSPSQPRVFSGFNSTPVPDDPPAREPSAPEPRPRTSSVSAASSSLLASFMALSEEAEANPEPEPVKPPPPKPSPPRIDVRPPSKPTAAPPPPPPLKTPPPKPPEPTYKVEDQAKHITPALSPDDPDYF
jgi:ubiquinone biosynthesis protein COQ4